MKTLIQSLFAFLLISFCLFPELAAQNIIINGISLDSAEVNWKYVKNGYAPYPAQTKEKARQINYRKSDTIRIEYGEKTELVISKKEESIKVFKNSKITNTVLQNQSITNNQEERSVNYGGDELDFEIYQVGKEYTESEKEEIGKLRKELLAVTRKYHVLSHKTSQIQRHKEESKNRFIGNSVQWHDTCFDRNGFFFYFPPTHIAQKLYQLGASIRAGFQMSGKNKKLVQLKSEQERIKKQIQTVGA